MHCIHEGEEGAMVINVAKSPFQEITGVRSGLSEQSKDLLTSLGLYMSARILMAFGTVLSLLGPKFTMGELPFFSFIWSMVHDDSGWYHFIASQGYIKQDTPFFPAYPLIISALHSVTGLDITTAGLLVSNAAEILALFIIIRLFRRIMNGHAARWGAALLAFFPMAIFLPAMYTESLFVLFIAATLLALMDKRFVWAGLCGFAAVLTRNEGILLLIPFLATLWQLYRETKRIPWRGIGLASLLPMAALMYMGYLAIKFGSPLLFSHEEQLWGRQFMFPLVTLWDGVSSFASLWALNGWYGHLYYSIEILAVAVSIISLPLVWRYLPKSWFWFTLAMILIPLSDPGVGRISITYVPHRIEDYFFSYPRFILAMIPLFAAWARFLDQYRSFRIVTVWMSWGGLIAASYFISKHIFLA